MTDDAVLIDKAWRASGLDQRRFALVLGYRNGRSVIQNKRKGKLPLTEKERQVCQALLQAMDSPYRP